RPACRRVPLAPSGTRHLRVECSVVKRVALIALTALVVPAAASADVAQERALAERYAPVVRVVALKGSCAPGDPYLPIDVDLLFDEPTVALRGPWHTADLVKIAPPATELAQGLYEYHLDFPGSALDPRCSYLDWERRLSTGHRPTAYAHVVGDPRHPG